jgi:hypothetical protein
MSERRSRARRGVFLKAVVLSFLSLSLSLVWTFNVFGQGPNEIRKYANQLTRIADPRPILADHPTFIQPVIETSRYESPCLVDDDGADLHV